MKKILLLSNNIQAEKSTTSPKNFNKWDKAHDDFTEDLKGDTAAAPSSVRSIDENTVFYKELR